MGFNSGFKGLMCLRRYISEPYGKIKLVECAGMFHCGYLTMSAVCDCINIPVSSFYKRPTAILRHCATSRKAAGWIPDDVIGIFHWHNPSCRAMALGLTQPLTEMSTYQKYFLGGKGGGCVGLTTLPPSCADCLEILKPQPPGSLTACPGL